MIIVAGRIYCRSGTRDEFVERSLEAVSAARQLNTCRDFVVAADPLDPDRVNVYEEWDTLESLLAFREDGPSEDLSSRIIRAEVKQHEIG